MIPSSMESAEAMIRTGRRSSADSSRGTPGYGRRGGRRIGETLRTTPRIKRSTSRRKTSRFLLLPRALGPKAHTEDHTIGAVLSPAAQEGQYTEYFYDLDTGDAARLA